MFPFPIATPQGCDIQTFYGTASVSERIIFSWNKPVGVSHVYIMLIGAGGNGDGSTGGGSGAVTVWYGAAQHVPDTLVVQPGLPGANADSDIYLRSRSTTPLLLRAVSSSGGVAGTATSAGPFAASGFYKSTAGQAGVSGSQNASATTFLSGGTSLNSSLAANYGYSLGTTGNYSGIFQMKPIIVGTGAKGSGSGGIGCGGGLDSGRGGPGMVLIASW